MEQRRYVHNRIEYIHAWEIDRHLHPQIAEIFGKNLLKYYQLVGSNEYPDEIFNDKEILRCSSFRIQGLRQNARKVISLDLIKKNKVFLIKNGMKFKNLSESIAKLPEMARVWHKIYLDTLKKNPGHGPVLDKILKINPNALSIETPIWTTTHSAVKDHELSITPFSCLCDEIFTGHIDLIMFDEKDQSLVICDYKPENQFLRSLAQVASYGLVMKRILHYEKVKCVSFSREKAWVYDPEILRTTIPQYLLQYGNPKLCWRDLIFSI